MRHRNMVGLLDAEELLRMHEFLPRRDCDACLGSGREVKMIVDRESGTLMGMAIGDVCSCCGGIGIHYLSYMS